MNGCFLLHNSNTEVSDDHCWCWCFLGLQHEGNLFTAHFSLPFIHLAPRSCTWKFLSKRSSRVNGEPEGFPAVSKGNTKTTRRMSRGWKRSLKQFQKSLFCRRSCTKLSRSSGKITTIMDNMINQSRRGGGL